MHEFVMWRQICVDFRWRWSILLAHQDGNHSAWGTCCQSSWCSVNAGCNSLCHC